MRGWALVLAVLVVVPAAAALRGVPVALDSRLTPLLPADLSDGDLLVLLAARQGWVVDHPAPVVVPATLTLSAAVSTLAARVHADVPSAELAAYDAVDPRVAASVLPLLVAIDEAWSMRDLAFVGVQGGETPDLPMLIRAAILVSDTAEGIVMPQVDALAQAGVWPATAVADSVGVLRLGGTGDDVEMITRILQIDPRGNDIYYNNAGGTTLLRQLSVTPFGVQAVPEDAFAIAVSIDLRGNDIYDSRSWAGRFIDGSQGSASLGNGLLIDAAGDDRYLCKDRCQGHALGGVAVLRDMSGNDFYRCGAYCEAVGSMGIGILRDDAGNDSYSPATTALAYGELEPGLALFWDRGGRDDYTTQNQYVSFYSVLFHANSADALFVDEGADVDIYSPSVSDAVNNRRWQHGTIFDTGSQNAEGNDNFGGLGWVFAQHWP